MENTIFIFGCGHSGNTIINKILSNHKNIYGVDYETEIFLKRSNMILTFLNDFNKKRKYFNKKWFCEKTPKHVHHINKLYLFTKNPKIIIMIRDGRDVVASLNKRYNDFNKSVSRWIDNNNEWLKNIHKEDFHILKYEDFISNPELELKKICNYIGEEYDENMLNYKKESIQLSFDINKIEKIDCKNHNELRKYQVNQSLYDGTKRYLKDLTKEQLDILYSNTEFMKLMNLFGYKI